MNYALREAGEAALAVISSYVIACIAIFIIESTEDKQKEAMLMTMKLSEMFNSTILPLLPLGHVY